MNVEEFLMPRESPPPAVQENEDGFVEKEETIEEEIAIEEDLISDDLSIDDSIIEENTIESQIEIQDADIPLLHKVKN